MQNGMSQDALWAVEEACCNAYPAWRQIILDGWLLRAAGGKTRRINSVNPLRAGPSDPSRVLDGAAEIYGRLGQPVLFRVPSFVSGMDAPLAHAGLDAEGEALTLCRDPELHAGLAGVDVLDRPEPSWFEAWQACRVDADAEMASAFRYAVGGLLVPSGFVSTTVQGQPVAVAYAALHHGIAVLEAVVTHPAHRQRGHARAVVCAVMTWAHRAGARTICLQVAGDNGPARALYRDLGFVRELYRYHYRVGRAPIG